MDPVTAKLMSAAGAAADPVYVDDVFSTFLYDGDGTTSQTITNGIDLSGEGGMVWIRNRDYEHHNLFDTHRGTGLALESSNNREQRAPGNTLTAFNSNGFTVSNNNTVGASGQEYCAWTFRKKPGFFDIVTFTANNSSSGVTVSHSLGSTPGSIWVKAYNIGSNTQTTDWWVWHRSGPVESSPPSGVPSGSLNGGRLNTNGSFSVSTNIINTVTSTSFKYGTNNSGYNDDTTTTYVAYIFAHDDQSFGDGGDEAIIKCGSYAGGHPNSVDVNLGFEPQWMLVKRYTSGGGNWALYDNMRGVPTGGGTTYLDANERSAEGTESSGLIDFTANGFTARGGSSRSNYSNSDSFIYIAIRRPHKPPSAGTEVLAQRLIVGSSSTQTVSVSGAGVTDMTIIKNVTSASHSWITASRLLGNGETKMNYTNAESTGTFGSSVNLWDQMSGTKLRYDIDINRNGNFYMHWQFTRKPGVFDVATYTGTGSNRTVSHNLGVTPELMIVKRRDSTGAWRVYSSVTGAGKYLRVDSNAAEATTSTRWNNTAPTSTAFTVGTASDVNASGGTYFNFLFATLTGVSKVDSYTGTGNDINVDCGFTAGARFVMIKRTDSSGDWYVFDTERGINSGNDSYAIVNSQANPVLNQDYIDPLNAGFTITSSAPAGLNASGGTYIFLAIA